MRLKLNVTLKATEAGKTIVWPAGEEFSDMGGGIIPRAIMKEFESKSGMVKEIPEPVLAKPSPSLSSEEGLEKDNQNPADVMEAEAAKAAAEVLKDSDEAPVVKAEGPSKKAEKKAKLKAK